MEEIAARVQEILEKTARGGDFPTPDTAQIPSLIDQTLLKPEATPARVEAFCEEAVQHRFAAVCVNPVHIGLVSQLLRGSSVKPCTVVGFPLGAVGSEIKARETEAALAHGAEELDMVIDIGALKAGELNRVAMDIRSVTAPAAKTGAMVKVIIETALLTDREKVTACLVAREAGAGMVKTSTGFAKGGAVARDVTLMRSAVGPDMGVKAAGGIRTLDDVLRMIRAGATRIGTSSGVRISKQGRNL